MPSTIVLGMRGRIDPTDVARLCDRVRLALEASGADLVVCDVSGIVDPDAVTVDALARMQLTARRLGRTIQLRSACADLMELLALAGLADVVGAQCRLGAQAGAGTKCGDRSDPESRLGLVGQTEEREQRRGVEERVDPADPTV